MDGNSVAILVSLGSFMIGNIAFISYKFGKLNQKVEDVSKGLGVMEKRFNEFMNSRGEKV